MTQETVTDRPVRHRPDPGTVSGHPRGCVVSAEFNRISTALRVPSTGFLPETGRSFVRGTFERPFEGPRRQGDVLEDVRRSRERRCGSQRCRGAVSPHTISRRPCGETLHQAEGAPAGGAGAPGWSGWEPRGKPGWSRINSESHARRSPTASHSAAHSATPESSLRPGRRKG